MQEVVLRDYQIEDIEKGVTWGNLINANPPGLGKTLETLLTIKALPKGTTLVICPVIATGVWKYEAALWLDWTSTRITGEFKPKERARLLAEYNRKATNLLIINMQMLPEVMKVLPVWDNVIVDEIHLVGLLNYKNKAATLCEQLQYKHIFLLSGTPVRKGLQDLYVALHLIDRKRFRSYWSYVNRWCQVVDNGFGKEILDVPKNPIEFEAMIQGYMVRHPKPTDLPAKVRQPYVIMMDKEQDKYYNDLTSDLMTEIGDNLIITPGQMQLCVRLRQLLVCPKILGGNTYGTGIEALATYLVPEEFEQGHSVVIATVFRAAIPYIIEALQLNIPDIHIEQIHGQIKEPAAVVAQRFQDTKGHRKALIYTVQSGASWTAHSACSGFMLGYDWSAINNLQAEDRIHRLGQVNNVIWRYIMYEDSMDADVLARLDERTMAAGWTLEASNMIKKIKDKQQENLLARSNPK